MALAQTSAENLQVPKLYSCKLTTDQRFLLFDEHELDVGPESALEPLEIAKILDLEPILDDKNQSAVSICLRAKMNGNDELSLRLDSPPEPSRKPSVVWLSALRKVKYIFFFGFKSIKIVLSGSWYGDWNKGWAVRLTAFYIKLLYIFTR